MHFKGLFSLILTLLHSGKAKDLYTILAFLSAIGFKEKKLVPSKDMKIIFVCNIF